MSTGSAHPAPRRQALRLAAADSAAKTSTGLTLLLSLLFLLAFETGYRLQPHARVSCEISLFYNLYDELRTTQQGGLTPAPSLPGNLVKGRYE